MKNLICKKEYMVTLTIILLLIVAGLWDKQISQNFINQGSLISTIFQDYGLVAPFIIVFMCLQIFCYIAIKSSLPWFSKIIVIVLSGAYGFYQFWQMVSIALYYTLSLRFNIQTGQPLGVANSDGAGSFEIPAWYLSAHIGLSLLCFLLGCFLCYRWLGKKTMADIQPLLLIAFGGIVAINGASILLGAMKDMWGRMRPYEVMNDWSLFTPWFHLNGETGHKSFPSGHSFQAWLAIFFPFFISPEQYKKRKLVLLCALIFAFTMSITRIRVGAHFLGDVTVGATISIVFVYATSRLFNQSFTGKRLYPVSKKQ